MSTLKLVIPVCIIMVFHLILSTTILGQVFESHLSQTFQSSYSACDEHSLEFKQFGGSDDTEQFGKNIFTGEVFRGSFAPDGKTFYFFKKVTKGQEDYRIFMSQFLCGKWGTPKRVNLGGEYSDLYPSISKDGNRMVFSSYRPAPGDKSEKPNAHLWYVDKNQDGWGAPVFMVNANKMGYYHSWVEFGWDGHVYFQRASPDWKTTTNLLTPWNGKEFSKPKPFKEVETWKTWNPKIRIVGGSPGPTKDIVFLDVATTNPKTKRGASDIWISRKKDGNWGTPKPLGKSINKHGYDVFPFFSPDGKYMYFVRDFDSFHRISLKKALDSIKE